MVEELKTGKEIYKRSTFKQTKAVGDMTDPINGENHFNIVRYRFQYT